MQKNDSYRLLFLAARFQTVFELGQYGHFTVKALKIMVLGP